MSIESRHTSLSGIQITIRAILSLYLVFSVPFRWAFIPEFLLKDIRYGGFIFADLIATIYFLWENYASLKITLNQVLPLNDLENPPSGSVRSLVTLADEENNRFPFIQTISRVKISSYISILSSIPFEYITLATDSNISINYFLFNRMIRIVFLPSYANDISRYLEEYGLMKNLSLHRTWKLFCAMALAGHWCGCVFFYIAKNEALKGNISTWPQIIGLFEVKMSIGNVNEESVYLQMNEGVAGMYIQSLYWAYITMITTGFGDIVPISIPETCWCIVSMYLGVVITTCAIANLQLLMTNMDAAQTNFQSKMERIKGYMRHRQLPAELQTRIISYYDYQWDLLKGADEEMFLLELPRSLQQQVSNFMCRDLISSLPILRRANTALLNALADAAESNIYSPGDFILKPGEHVKGVLLLARGEIEVFRGNTVERKMKRLDRFAEDSLFEKVISQNLVRAKTFCEIFQLSRESFQEIINIQCDEGHICQMRDIAEKLKKSNAKANKMFGSGEAIITYKGFQKYCLPGSSFRKWWDVLMFLVSIMSIFTVGLNAMLCVQDRSLNDDAFLLLFGYMTDFLFIADLVLSSKYFMHLEEGLIVFDSNRIYARFVTRRSIVSETIAALPIDFLALFLGTRYLNGLRLSKILRFSTVFQYQSSVEKLAVESKFELSQSLRRVIKLNFMMILFCHWVGCLWYMSSDLSWEIGLESNWKDEDCNDPSLAISHSDLGGTSGYIRSVYWAIVGMSTVGYGDIIPTNYLETTLATFIILFGGLVLPAVVGGLAAYMGNLNQTVQEQRKKVAHALSYMKKESLSQEIVDKVLRYYNYVWSTQCGIEEQDIMKELPEPLRQRVALFVNGKDIDSIPFFSSCDDGIKENLVSALVPKIFLPNDAILRQGEFGREMYLIEQGSVHVTTKDHSISFCILSKGDYFGESCLLGAQCTRLATVIALSYCDCFILSKDAFDEVMESYMAHERFSIIDGTASIIHQKVKTNSNITDNFKNRPKCERITGGMIFSCIESTVSHQKAHFHPDSKFRKGWNVILLIVFVYNLWCIPFRIAFESNIPFYIMDWPFDLLLLFDMYLNCFEFTFIRNGELIVDKESIKHNYFHDRFRSDICSTFPFDLLVTVSLNHSSHKALIVAILRAPKLLRLQRLTDTFYDILRTLEENNVGVAPVQLVCLLSGVCLVAHWAGCGFYAFARWKNANEACLDLMALGSELHLGNLYSECRWLNTWMEKQIINGKVPHEGGSTFQRYLRSFHWALPTLVVVVIGDVVPITSAETLYALVWMVVGVTINATIIGSVANLVANLETDSSKFLKKADEIKHFMHLHRVNQKLKYRVNDFMNDLWTMHGGVIDHGAFIMELPSTLQQSISDYTRLSHIKSCPFFDFCSEEVIRILAMCLHPLVFSVGDVLIQYGDMGQEMFFLEKGSVEVVSGDEKTIFATLTKGNFFGETGLFFKTKRSTTIRALTFCEVFRLDKVDLDNELRQCEFDLSRMLSIFTSIKNSNTRRNTALASNLSIARKDGSKLFKVLGMDSHIISTNMQGKKVSSAFLPQSFFRSFWDIHCLMLTLYLSIIVLYRIAFTFDWDNQDIYHWLAVDFVIDAFFVADVYLRYNKFAIYQDGKLLFDDDLKRAYRSDSMMIDMLAAFPVEIFAVNFGLQSIFFLRAFHLIRIIRLPAYFKQMETHLNSWNIRISAANSLLFTMFTYYILINHWCACGWFIIHRYIERSVEFTWATSDCPGGGSCLAVWNELEGEHNVCDGGDIWRCYIRSFYFVITTISTVGYGDISPVTELETIYEDIVVLIGACIFAGIIGAFTAFLSHSDTSGSNAFQLKMQKLHEYMVYRNLPSDLQENIISHHTNKWERYQIIDEDAVLDSLPVPLQMDLSFAALESIIKLVPIFCKRSIIVQKRITHALRLQICSTGSVIYSVGDIGFDIYFIGAGLVKLNLPKDESLLDAEGKQALDRVRTRAESVGTMYRSGNHFGESCLLGTSGVRQETVVAHATSELYLISKDDINNICSYMSSEDRKSFFEDIIRRNGKIWHSFEDDFQDECTTKTIKREKQFPVGSVSISGNKHNMTSRRNPINRKDKVRLRSFSAEASQEAISKSTRRGSSRRAKINSGVYEGELNTVVKTHLDSTRKAICKIQSLVQHGDIDLPTLSDRSSDDDSSSSCTSTDEEDCSTSSQSKPAIRIGWMRRRSSVVDSSISLR